jgi:hypothetical protein
MKTNRAVCKVEWPRKARGLKQIAALFPRHTDRAGAASLVRMAGLEVFVGGHHVAIHNPGSTLRVAIITGSGPDWE